MFFFCLLILFLLCISSRNEIVEEEHDSESLGSDELLSDFSLNSEGEFVER